MEDKTWQKNAGSQIVLDSIFAALAAVWITLAIPEGIHTKLKFFEVVCSLLSFFCFAASAEGTTTAYDEKDVVKFVYYLLWYNLGVILIGLAIAALVFAHFEEHFLRFIGSSLPSISPHVTLLLLPFIYGGFFFLLLWQWIRDAVWLLFASKVGFQSYLKELNDEEVPELHRRWLMRRIFKHRL
jgi:Gpi18-like mannosyltransferase